MARTSPAFGHPPLRGEGSGYQCGHLAPLLALPLDSGSPPF